MTAPTSLPRRSTIAEPPDLEPEQLLVIAHGLARSAEHWPHHAHPAARERWSLAATEQFHAVAIRWTPGAHRALHDHGGSTGAIVVAAGSLFETEFISNDQEPLQTVSRTVLAGEHILIGPGHVHDMINLGAVPALSVHVYSPLLRSMTYYREVPGDRLVAVRTEVVSGRASDPRLPSQSSSA